MLQPVIRHSYLFNYVIYPRIAEPRGCMLIHQIKLFSFFGSKRCITPKLSLLSYNRLEPCLSMSAPMIFIYKYKPTMTSTSEAIGNSPYGPDRVTVHPLPPPPPRTVQDYVSFAPQTSPTSKIDAIKTMLRCTTCLGSFEICEITYRTITSVLKQLELRFWCTYPCFLV